MNNLYHKVAVTCIYTALSFILVINKEAKAATLSAQKTEEFFVECISGPFSGTLTGPESGPSGHSFSVSRNLEPYNVRSAFFEFSMPSNLSFIRSAVFIIQSEDMKPGDSISVDIYGSTEKANPLKSASVKPLGNLFFTHPNTAMLDVTQLVSEGVRNRDAFMTFGIATPTSYNSYSALSLTYYGPRLIIETADVAEPVPEPTTIFGSALALGVGGWLKRTKSSQQNKTTSQN